MRRDLAPENWSRPARVTNGQFARIIGFVEADIRFLIESDAKATDWLDSHHDDGPRIITYDISRGRRGMRICSVEVRPRTQRDDHRACVTARLEDGSLLFVDRRAAERLPRRFGLTVRGLGSRRHLELALDGPGWGRLLYD